MNSNIRATESADLPATKIIIDAVELFPSDLLDSMFLASPNDSDQHEFWLTFDDGKPSAIAYCAPEPMTVNAWNLLLIAVHPERHGEGIGTALMCHVEQKLRSAGGRILLVETSGTDGFVKTRSFYSHLGYNEEARIRDYYDSGDDKIVFHKQL